MRMRDRRGPFAALVLSIGYLLLMLTAGATFLVWLGHGEPMALSPLMEALLAINIVAFGWRIAARFAFTMREYGAIEGMRAILRIPVTNIIAIMAGRRALVAYCKTLRGQPVVWDKTHHSLHPAARVPEVTA